MKKVVYVHCDGLGRSWIKKSSMPFLWRLLIEGQYFSQYHAVYPSATRPSAATVATGAFPGAHGLTGNRLVLQKEGALEVFDVGDPNFFPQWRSLRSGTALRLPTLAERLKDFGGFRAFSNVSAGAAYALDPDHFGYIHHRAGSFGPGGVRLTEPLKGDDISGDWWMARKFVDHLRKTGSESVHFLWLANPDKTLHTNPLGSVTHIEALKSADEIIRYVHAVVRDLRRQGMDILFLTGSDHGHESVGQGININKWAEEAGFGPELRSGALAFATQGLSFTIYAQNMSEARQAQLLAHLERQAWVGEIKTVEQLQDIGLRDDALLAAVNMSGYVHDHGVQKRYAAFENDAFEHIGFGQHGGWGDEEMAPYLVLEHPDLPSKNIDAKTTLTDIAPTILDFLNVAYQGLDGKSRWPASKFH